MEVYIKYFFLLFCSFFFFTKLLNIKSSKHNIFFTVLISMALSAGYHLQIVPVYFNNLILTALLILSTILIYKKDLNTSITTAIISFGLSYVAFVISTLLFSPMIILQIAIKIPQNIYNILSFLIVGILQMLISSIPFRIKRLKNGMPFLQEHGSSEIGAFISICIVFATLLFNISTESNLIFLILIFTIIIGGLTIFHWWRKSLTKSYATKIRLLEIEQLKSEVQKQKNEISTLKQHNEELSKIIHKDNKIIPAMEIAVKSLIMSQNNPDDSISAASTELITQLEILSSERNGTIKNYEKNNKKMPPTEIASVDGLIQYLLCRANEYNINFDLLITGSIKFMLKNIISENDMNTLLADLTENALIATKNQNCRNVLLNIGIDNQHYYIDIFDSGTPFQPETLANIGKVRYTTHLNDGGSGIGMMTTFELLKKYNASITIDECIIHNIFTKKISIHFDNLCEYRIKTKRNEVFDTCSQRDDIILIK